MSRDKKIISLDGVFSHTVKGKDIIYYIKNDEMHVKAIRPSSSGNNILIVKKDEVIQYKVVIIPSYSIEKEKEEKEQDLYGNIGFSYIDNQNESYGRYHWYLNIPYDNKNSFYTEGSRENRENRVDRNFVMYTHKNYSIFKGENTNKLRSILLNTNRQEYEGFSYKDEKTNATIGQTIYEEDLKDKKAEYLDIKREEGKKIYEFNYRNSREDYFDHYRFQYIQKDILKNYDIRTSIDYTLKENVQKGSYLLNLNYFNPNDVFFKYASYNYSVVPNGQQSSNYEDDLVRENINLAAYFNTKKPVGKNSFFTYSLRPRVGYSLYGFDRARSFGFNNSLAYSNKFFNYTLSYNKNGQLLENSSIIKDVFRNQIETRLKNQSFVGFEVENELNNSGDKNLSNQLYYKNTDSNLNYRFGIGSYLYSTPNNNFQGTQVETELSFSYKRFRFFNSVEIRSGDNNYKSNKLRTRLSYQNKRHSFSFVNDYEIVKNNNVSLEQSNNYLTYNYKFNEKFNIKKYVENREIVIYTFKDKNFNGIMDEDEEPIGYPVYYQDSIVEDNSLNYLDYGVYSFKLGEKENLYPLNEQDIQFSISITEDSKYKVKYIPIVEAENISYKVHNFSGDITTEIYLDLICSGKAVKTYGIYSYTVNILKPKDMECDIEINKKLSKSGTKISEIKDNTLYFKKELVLTGYFYKDKNKNNRFNEGEGISVEFSIGNKKYRSDNEGEFYIILDKLTNKIKVKNKNCEIRNIESSIKLNQEIFIKCK